MSAQSVLDSFTPQIEAACAEGRGRELHDLFIKELAADCADKVFLKMGAELENVTPDIETDLFDWLETFPYWRGLNLIEAVSTSSASFGFSVEAIEATVELAAVAYRDRLSALMTTSGAGGLA